MHHQRCLLVLALLLLALSAAGQNTLSGHVVGGGLPIAGVRVTANNNGGTVTTNANGDFVFLNLQNRTYVLDVIPATSQWAPVQVTIAVNGPTGLGTLTLLPGAAVTGTVVGPTGLPLQGVNMNAYDQNGVKLFTPNDGTNALGQFSITVPLGVIRVRAVPPTGLQLVSQDRVLLVQGPINMGTIRLPPGHVVSGSVVDAVTNLPIAGVELTTFDSLTKLEIVQLQNTTNGFGTFSLLLPFGIADLEIVPPAGNAHVARQMFGQIIIGPTNLGQIRLDPAIVLSGTVLGPGGPVGGCDLDAYTADGYKLFTARDNTDASGTYQLMVPPGTWSLRVDPPRTAGLVGTRTAPAAYASNTGLAPINLTGGLALDLVILGPNGPEYDADIDLLDPLTGEQLVTVGDHTDPSGHLRTFVPPGVFDVAVDAAQGSLAASLRFSGLPFFAPLTATLPLPTKPIMIDIRGYGTPTISQGGYVPTSISFHNTSPVPLPVVFETVVRYSSGAETPVFPPVAIAIVPQLPLTLSGVWIPIPPVPQSQLGRLLELMVRFRDPATNAVLDQAHTDFVVR